MKTYDTLVDVDILQQHLDDKHWVVIDSRYDLTNPQAGHMAYEQGHIPGALYVDLHKDLSGPPVTDHGRHPLPDEEQLIKLFTSLGINGSTQVVVYDASFGAVAARFWWMLRYMGHEAVAVLDGGWQAWEKSGFNTENEVNIGRSATFTGKANKDWLVTVSEISEVDLLLDSREPARYRGEIEPMDPVAGHIPGAKNRFFKNNLDENGNFQSSEQLKYALLDQYGSVQPERAVFYCGSGVTGCHNVLAAAHAGLAIPRLYVGSWSEWCLDPNRAIATGDE